MLFWLYNLMTSLWKPSIIVDEKRNVYMYNVITPLPSPTPTDLLYDCLIVTWYKQGCANLIPGMYKNYVKSILLTIIRYTIITSLGIGTCTLYSEYVKLNEMLTCIMGTWALLRVKRVLTKISSCRVNTTSRWGIKQLGVSFCSVFLLFFYWGLHPW